MDDKGCGGGRMRPLPVDLGPAGACWGEGDDRECCAGPRPEGWPWQRSDGEGKTQEGKLRKSLCSEDIFGFF